MESLASILAGAPASPYQASGTGGGIAPLLNQMLLARQMGAQQLGQGLGGSMQGTGLPPMQPMQQQPTMGQPSLPQGFGSMGALPALISGAY